MFNVLLRAFSFTLIIIIGIWLKSSGMVSQDAGAAVKKLLIYITLPCAIITNFSAMEKVQMSMLFLVGLGIAFNVIMIVVGAIMTRKRSNPDKALYMLGLPAYNIGAFCLPFVQSFLPSLGSVTACIFDVGNSIMCTGGTYAFVGEYTSDEKKGFDIRGVFKRLLSSPPLITYVVMCILSFVNIKLPQPVLTLISPMATANTFVAMMMLGLLFRLEFKKEYLKEVFTVIGVRHIFAVLAALFCYFVLPFDIVIRQTLVLLCFGPMSAVAPAYTGMCGGDEGMSSCMNSVSIICSLITITCLVAVMGLGV